MLSTSFTRSTRESSNCAARSAASQSGELLSWFDSLQRRSAVHVKLLETPLD